jgi:uncharacterized membrane protein
MLAISTWWIVGWGVGVVVIALVAALVLVIAGLARQVTRQADEITEALDGTRANTEALFAVKNTNIAIDRITRGLRRVRTGGAR